MASTAKGARKEPGGTSKGRRVVVTVLVVLVPLIALPIMVGAALQVVGVPVWQTALKMIGHQTVAKVVQSPLSTAQQNLAQETAKNQVLTSQVQALQAQLSQAQGKQQALQKQVSQLQGKLNVSVNAVAAAKQEGQVLAGMDAAQAANVLSSMSIQDAAAVVATMSASDSGAILAAVDAAKAGQILALAAQDKLQNDAATANSTGNATG